MTKNFFEEKTDCPYSKRVVRSMLAAAQPGGINEGKFDLYSVDLTHGELDESCKAAVTWIENFRTEYGKIPTEEQLLEHHYLNFTKEPEDPAYAASVLRKIKLERRIEEDLKKSAKLLRDSGPESAIEYLQSLHYSLDTGKVYEFVAGAEARYQRYLDNKNKPVRGIKFPWPTLNEATELIQGELTVFIALSSSGKSWQSISMAANCLRQGHKVLLVTAEMTAEAFEARLDCVYYKLPFRDRKKELDVFTEQRWLEEMKSPREGEIFICDKSTAKTVSDVKALVHKHCPDVVIIDGAYLLEGTGKGDWERTKSVVLEIHDACIATNLPWVITTQQNPSDKKVMDNKERAAKVRYGKEYWLSASNMVEISQSEEQQQVTRQVTLRLLKWREADKALARSEFQVWLDTENAKYDEVTEQDLENGVVEVDF